ncbi:MAG: L-rhamnose mutarotase [Kiritimatiellales bacterium]
MRFARVIGLRREAVEEYRKLHAEIWPEIAEAIRQVGLHNYSIHLREFPDGNIYLFSYFEYTGSDFKADIARLSNVPRMDEWNACCEACQIPLGNRNEREWWAEMEEVFFQD